MNLSQQFQKVRKRTTDLCLPLEIEDYIPQPAEFTSPPKWHLAHTTWFFEEFLLKPNVPEYEVFHQDFSFLFNSYYNNVGERTLRAHRGLMTRPTVGQIMDYRKHVDSAILNWLKNDDLAPELSQLIVLGLNHEQQHQELLLTDLKYTLSLNPTFPVYESGFVLSEGDNMESGFYQLSEGIYNIGFEGNDFSFDNEHSLHKTYCQSTQINKALVTAGEFIEFMNDGGYNNHNLWLDEGWAWVQKEQIDAPLYWHFQNDSWHHFTLAGLRPINSNQTLCHVNYYEASAFAEWAGMRLPTEFEWEASQEHLKWGERWEWTQSAYLPYPNFRKPSGAVGEYNGKFMVNQMVLRGSSLATAPGHSRPTYRNFFHPQYRWQYSGIRLAKNS